MGHVVERHQLQRASTMLLLGLLWSGLVACALGALAYDLVLWLGD